MRNPQGVPERKRQIGVLGSDGNIQIADLDFGEMGASPDLPYAPARYFALNASTIPIRVEELVLSHVRAQGVANAAQLMRAAFEGQHAKRQPVSVRKIPGGLFLVLDGNSTVLNACFSGWPDIPCEMTESTTEDEGCRDSLPGGGT